MSKKHIAISIASALLLIFGGCSKFNKSKATCSSPEGLSAISELISGEAGKAIQNSKKDDGSPIFTASAVKTILGKIIISVDNIRTSKEDPNSTKVSCQGTLNIAVPAEILNQAEQGRQLAGQDKISNFAQLQEMTQDGNSFTKDIEYNIQPTDDGKKIFSEMTGTAPIANLIGEVVSANLLKPIIEASRSEEAKKETEANQELLKQSQSENEQATKEVSEYLKGLPEESKKLIIDEQKAWEKKKNADCKTQSEKAGPNFATKELTRLKCDTDAQHDRYQELSPGE